MPVAYMPQHGKTRSVWRFDRFEIDIDRGVLRSGSVDIALRPKATSLLLYLASNPRRLLSKEQLLDAVWPGVVVGSDSIVQCVGELRAALGDSGGLIRNVPRRGYVFETDVVPLECVEPAGSHPASGSLHLVGRPRMLKALVLCAVLLGFVGTAAWWMGSKPAHIDSGIAARRAIAVLPFSAVGEASAPGLAATVTEDVTRAVALLPSTLVFAGASVEGFAGLRPNVAAAGQQLHATHALTGSVERKGGDGPVIVRSQLQRADDGMVLWSDRFEYQGADGADAWLANTTQRIANALDTRLIDAHLAQEAGAGGNADAIEFTQQAYAIVRTVRTRADILKARALLDRALAADPDSATASQLWGHTHLQEVQRRWASDPADAIAIALRAANQVIAKHPDFAMAYYTRGSAFFAANRIDEAAIDAARVLELWPNEPRSLQLLAQIRLRQGRFEEVAPLAELSLQINPLESNQVGWAHLYLALAQFYQGHEDAAYEHAKQSTQSNPHSPASWLLRASIDALHARDADAREMAARYLAIAPGQTVSRIRSTDVPSNAEFEKLRSRYYQGLELAGIPR